MRNLSQILLVCLTFFGTAAALPISAQEATPKTTDKTDKDETKQGLELLKLAIGEIHTLKLPENRTYQLSQAATTLAHFDEKKARELVPEIIENIKLMFSKAEENTNQNRHFFLRKMAREEAILAIAKFDYGLALEISRTTRPISNHELTLKELQQADATLEQNLAAQLVNNNPEAALQATEQSLEKGFSYELRNLITTVLKKAPDKADKLLDKIYQKLQREDLLVNQQALQFATGFLSEEIKAHKKELTPGEKMYGLTNRKPALSKEDLKKWTELVVRNTLSLPSRFDSLKDNINIIYSIQQLRAQLNATAPELVQPVDTMLAKIRPKIPEQNRDNIEMHLLGGEGKLDDMLSLIEKAPKEKKDELLWNPIHLAINYYADTDLANKIIDNHVTSPEKKKEYRSFVAWLSAQILAEQGKLDEALNALNYITDNFEKIRTLVRMAQTNVKKKEIKLQLLDQALLMLGNDLTISNAADAFNQISLAYVEVDAERGFALFEPQVETMNPIWHAAGVFCSFESTTATCRAKNNELIFNKRSWTIGALNTFLAVFAPLGKENLTRANALTHHIQNPEVRLAAILQMLEGKLVPSEQ